MTIDSEILRSSFADPANVWVCRGRFDHIHEHPHHAENGESAETACRSVETRTYQFQSEPLDLSLVLIAELADGSLSRVDVVWYGTNFDVTSAALYAKLEELAVVGMHKAAADLVTRLTGAAG